MAVDRTPGDFGSRLRDARERRGMSLRHIANATKITVAALDALERNDASRLPGGIFSRAFVRSYAIEVGLDPDQAIQEFIAQFPNEAVTGRLQGRPAGEGGNSGNPENAGSLSSLGSPGEVDAAVGNRRIAPAVAAFILTLLVGGGALYVRPSGRGGAAAAFDFGLKEYGQVRAFLHGKSHAARAGVSASPPAVALPVDNSIPAEPPQPVAGPDEAAGADKNAARAANAAGATRAAVTVASASGPGPVAASGSAPAVPLTDTASAELLTVVLFARGPCWVSATTDGRKAIDRLLQTGERRTLEVRGDLVMTAGDAAAITMTLNGAEARPFGKPGEVVTVRLNPANFREYLPRR